MAGTGRLSGSTAIVTAAGQGLGEDAVATPEIEVETHRAMLQAFSAEVAERHPDLEIGTYMMELDGSVEAL